VFSDAPSALASKLTQLVACLFPLLVVCPPLSAAFDTVNIHVLIVVQQVYPHVVIQKEFVVVQASELNHMAWAHGKG
jgi:hypothetical protein